MRLCVAASPSVCLLCLWQHHEAPNGTAFGLWGERQTHKGAEKDPWTHRSNSSRAQRTVWAPIPLTFWWPKVHVQQRLGLTLSLWTSFSDESKLRHQQQELEQSWVEVRRAAAGREQAEHNLQLIQAQLGECRVNLEEVSRELLHQQERSDRGECAWFLTLTYPGNTRFGPFWSHFHTISFAWKHHWNRN